MSEEKANQRVEEFKREMKTLTVRLKEAENRAEQAEKSVKRLQKEVDRLEGLSLGHRPQHLVLILLFIDHGSLALTQLLNVHLLILLSVHRVFFI